MKRNSGWALFFILVFLCSVMLALPVLAGEGDGSGGGKNQPLALLGSSPTDGQKDVTLPVEIKLTFSKNVVYMTVRDNNQKCFGLYSPDGKEVPIEVIMADDQVEFEKRRDIVVKPLQELQAGTTYTVKVAPQLESKSGVNLGEEVKVSFTTAGSVAGNIEKAASTGRDSADADNHNTQSSNNGLPDPSEQTAQKAANDGQTTNGEQAGNVTGTTAKDLGNESNQPGSAADEKENNTRNVNTGIVIAGAIILATALAYTMYRKGKQ